MMAQQLVLPLTLYRHPSAKVTLEEITAVGAAAAKLWEPADIFQRQGNLLDPMV